MKTLISILLALCVMFTTTAKAEFDVLDAVSAYDKSDSGLMFCKLKPVASSHHIAVIVKFNTALIQFGTPAKVTEFYGGYDMKLAIDDLRNYEIKKQYDKNLLMKFDLYNEIEYGNYTAIGKDSEFFKDPLNPNYSMFIMKNNINGEHKLTLVFTGNGHESIAVIEGKIDKFADCLEHAMMLQNALHKRNSEQDKEFL